MSAAVDTFKIAGPEVIAKDFGDELVVANLDTGLFYSLTGSAAEIWLDLVGGVPLASTLSSFAGGNPSEITAFVERLRSEQLVVASPANGSMASASLKRPYLSPTLERFEDLQGLLLVDPIHEVSEAGWPLLPAQSDRS